MDRFFRSLGFSRGAIQIVLPRTDYALGEVIEGELVYQLKQPADGNRLSIDVRASQSVTEPKVERVHRDGRWHREVRRSTRQHILYEYRQELDGQRRYDEGIYPFQLPLPRQFSDLTPDSDLVKVAEMAASLSTGIPIQRGPVVWTLECKLEIPWSLGMTDKLTIRVHQSARSEQPVAQAPAAPGAKKFCGGCGTPREPDDRFCTSCGKPF